MTISTRSMGSGEPSSNSPILLIGGLVAGLSLMAVIVIAVVLWVSLNTPEVIPTIPLWTADDYEEEEEFEDITIRPQPSRPRPVTPTPAEPAAPQLAPTTLSITDGTVLTGLQVSCPSAGINVRVPLVNQKATTPALPVQGSCTVNFRGGGAYKLVPIRGGQTLSCTFGSGIAKCN